MGNFKIGQKVVCIDDSRGAISGTKPLKLNEIYTIAALHLNGKGVFLEEASTGYFNGSFAKERFKPLDEKDNFAENLCAKLIEEFKEEQKKEYINN